MNFATFHTQILRLKAVVGDKCKLSDPEYRRLLGECKGNVERAVEKIYTEPRYGLCSKFESGGSAGSGGLKRKNVVTSQAEPICLEDSVKKSKHVASEVRGDGFNSGTLNRDIIELIDSSDDDEVPDVPSNPTAAASTEPLPTSAATHAQRHSEFLPNVTGTSSHVTETNSADITGFDCATGGEAIDEGRASGSFVTGRNESQPKVVNMESIEVASAPKVVNMEAIEIESIPGSARKESPSSDTNDLVALPNMKWSVWIGSFRARGCCTSRYRPQDVPAEGTQVELRAQARQAVKKGKKEVLPPPNTIQAVENVSVRCFLNGRDLGRFTNEWSRVLGPLMLLGVVNVDAAIGSDPPSNLEPGCSFPLYISVAIPSSAFDSADLLKATDDDEKFSALVRCCWRATFLNCGLRAVRAVVDLGDS